MFGLSGPFYDPGPSASHDSFGYETAISILVDSQKAGRYSLSHKQWDTIRKVKTSVGNFERVASDPYFGGASFVSDDKGLASRLHVGGASSYWQQRFLGGCKARMGVDVRSNLGVSTKLWKKLLETCELNITRTANFDEKAAWTMAGAYLAFGYVLSLRGPEGFLMEIGLLEENKELRDGLVWLPIVGKLKGSKTAYIHMMRSIVRTGSGIDVQVWRDRLLLIHKEAGRTHGPAFCDSDGYLMTNLAMNELLWTALEEIFLEEPDFFPKAITCIEDIRLLIQIHRTMRRTSTSQATRAGVRASDIDIINRWTTIERSRGQDPSEHLRVHYAEQELLNDCHRRYQHAL